MFKKYLKIEIVSFILVFAYSSAIEVSNSTDQNITVTCSHEHDYDDLDIRKVLRKWYVLEVYLHLNNDGVRRYLSCPNIIIWETEDFPRSTYGPSTENQLFHVQHINARFRQQYRHLRLLWDEAGETSEYALYFKNDSAGYWQVYDGQNGTLSSRPNYQQFSGTVQVLKAVQDHLVLSFCQEPVNGKPAQLFSVLFSREPGAMSRWEIDSVHNMLQNKKLSVASRRMVCGNGADRHLQSIFMSILTCLLAVFLGTS